MKNIAIFASGSGTNAENIVKYFSESNNITVKLILSNNKSAYVLKRAEQLNVTHHVFNREELYDSDVIIKLLEEYEIDLIVLAGFLWLIPKNLINNFKIINIHPALLPKYGGKGMYGIKVHKTVKLSGDSESGITIHYINEKYDKGEIIFQTKCKVENSDTPESLAKKIHKLEYEYFPKVIEDILKQKSSEF